MPKNSKKSALEQLDTGLLRFAPLRELPPPRKGWIRAIRNALGMSGRQLAKRLGVSRMRVADIERAEVAGATTLKSLRRAAEAMDCVLVYALVPKTTLKDTLRNQARRKARQDTARAAQTMGLEDQALTREESDKAMDVAMESLLDKMPRTLWD